MSLNVKNQILDIYPALKPAKKKLADYVIEHTREIIYNSITELAELSGVSETTIIRFCRTMGYEGYQDFKIKIAQEMVPEDKQSGPEDEEVLPIIKNVFNTNINTLKETLAVIDPNEFIKAVDSIIKADKIIIIGEGGSGIVALDTENKLIQIGLPVYSYIDPYMQFAAASLLKKDNVVLVFSVSGSTKNMVNVIKEAKKSEATVICITRYKKSPVAKVSDIILPVYSQEKEMQPEYIKYRIAQSCIIDTIYVEITRRLSNESWKNINKIQKAQVSLRY